MRKELFIQVYPPNEVPTQCVAIPPNWPLCCCTARTWLGWQCHGGVCCHCTHCLGSPPFCAKSQLQRCVMVAYTTKADREVTTSIRPQCPLFSKHLCCVRKTSRGLLCSIQLQKKCPYIFACFNEGQGLWCSSSNGIVCIPLSMFASLSVKLCLRCPSEVVTVPTSAQPISCHVFRPLQVLYTCVVHCR